MTTTLSGWPRKLLRGGRKEYTDDAGTVTKVVEGFGYQRHLLVAVKHAVALASHLPDTKAGDNEEMESLVRQAPSNLPADRLETWADDKAADDLKGPEMLRDEGIKPVIQNRSCWPEGDTERLLGGRLPWHVVHEEQGTSYCGDTSSEPPVWRPMSSVGQEKDRGTLKYRGPAKVEGFACGREENGNADKPYGMTVRGPQASDRRRLPPIPRGTKQFERRYQGRTSVERVHARRKICWGLDDGNVVGSRRFHAHVGAVLVAHLACATVLAASPRYEGTCGTMPLSPIAVQLREAMKKPAAEAAA